MSQVSTPSQAIKFLYESGFHTLGHIHTGNIFVEEIPGGDGVEMVCKLGGYSETLLGYRTRLYADIVKGNLLKHIDIIMFGKPIARDIRTSSKINSFKKSKFSVP